MAMAMRRPRTRSAKPHSDRRESAKPAVVGVVVAVAVVAIALLEVRVRAVAFRRLNVHALRRAYRGGALRLDLRGRTQHLERVCAAHKATEAQRLSLWMDVLAGLVAPQPLPQQAALALALALALPVQHRCTPVVHVHASQHGGGQRRRPLRQRRLRATRVGRRQ